MCGFLLGIYFKNRQTEAEKKAYDRLREEEEKRHNEQLQLLKTQFKELAGEVLEEKSDLMKRKNKEQLNDLLDPFKDKLKDLSETVQASRTENAASRMSVEKMVEQLMTQTTNIGMEAKRLTAALTHESKTQGDWGETILERILEDSGLRKGEEYFPQENVKDDEGKNLRPDMVVRLPGQRQVIIDAKTSLTAYVDYVNAQDELTRNERLKAHLQSVKTHVDELARKNYPKSFKGKAVDYVLMFIPNEGSYITAMQADRDLALYAYRKNVILINPTNLMLALKLVYSLWQAERQNKNVEKIVERAEKMYERFVVFSNTYQDMEKTIQKLSATYEKGKSQLVSGRGNITKRLTDLKKCGLNPSKEFSSEVLEQSAEDSQIEEN